MTLEGIGLIKEAKNFLVDLKSCCSFGDLKEYYEKLTFLYQREHSDVSKFHWKL